MYKYIYKFNDNNGEFKIWDEIGASPSKNDYFHL